MLKNKISSINFKTLLYLVIFSVAIVLFLMISQSVIVKYSYERYQIKKIQDIAEVIKGYELGSLYRGLENIAYDNSVCIEYVTSTNTISYNTLMVGCELKEDNTKIINIMNDIMENNKDLEQKKLINKESDTKALLTGIRVDNGYIFVYSPLEDIDGAGMILQGQIIFIALIVIVIACFISYFLSNKITMPITNITKKAKELGEGNYNIKFDSSDV